jgi:ferric-dicitrate binding protein FerR (iron transport regulator)
MTSDELIARYLDEIAGDEEHAELDRLLREDPAAAAAFARDSRRDHALAALFREERAIAGVAAKVPARHLRFLAGAAAAAALVALLLLFRGPGPTAAIVSLEGQVTLARGPARAGLELVPGDRLATARGWVTLGYADGTRLILGPGSALVLEGARTAKRAALLSGRLEASVVPQEEGGSLTLATPHAEARVLGTRFTLSVTAASTRLSVLEGRVRLTRLCDSGSVEVAGGEAAAADSSPRTRLATRSIHEERFLEIWNELHDPANGYFSPDGVPYHAAETLVVEGPDHGRLTTSETFSYWIWLEAAYGRTTGDWGPFRAAWAKMEEVLIPSAADQPTNRAYDPGKPATFAAEKGRPEEYPVPLEPGTPVGRDPLALELEKSHGTRDLYAMHWLADPDDGYGFGRRGARGRRNALINTYQRGPHESVWETIPHPSWEDFGSGGLHGYLDLFIREPRYQKQWRYVCAPDADARVVQAAFWAARWAAEQKLDPKSVVPVGKAARLGDTLRYALHEKHFRGDPHYLLSWSFGWGGALEQENAWAWRAGSSHLHAGYQNPLAAWVLAESPAFRAPSPGAASDWAASLTRQLEFLRWLQSADGAIAGGATVAADGKGDFHGLSYVEHPVFLDPPSNAWFGWQAWTMERVAAYASLTKDPRAAAILDKWAGWARRVVDLGPGNAYAVPSALRWRGRPDAWNPSRPGENAGLRVEVASRHWDVGVTAALARALLHHDQPESRRLAAELLDRMWARARDGKGLAVDEMRPEYSRLFDPVHLPGGWSGRTPGGKEIRAGATFADLRPPLRGDPGFPGVERAIRSGAAPIFRFHRFWAQVEAALAYAERSRLPR